MIRVCASDLLEQIFVCKGVRAGLSLLLIMPRWEAVEKDSDKHSHRVPERLLLATVHSSAYSPQPSFPSCPWLLLFSGACSVTSKKAIVQRGPGGQKVQGVLGQGPVEVWLDNSHPGM